MNWDRYKPYFTEAEFKCKHTGKCEMSEDFMAKLYELRHEFGAPMVISSGYRDKTHPGEAGKTAAGAHTMGRACDILISGKDALALLRLALSMGFTGIGIQQKGNSRFIHLDDLPNSKDFIRPTIWSY
jgi:uncharacterized protein YcbK (DUF882 family)